MSFLLVWWYTYVYLSFDQFNGIFVLFWFQCFDMLDFGIRYNFQNWFLIEELRFEGLALEYTSSKNGAIRCLLDDKNKTFIFCCYSEFVFPSKSRIGIWNMNVVDVFVSPQKKVTILIKKLYIVAIICNATNTSTPTQNLIIKKSL